MDWLTAHLLVILLLAVTIPTGLVILQQWRSPQSTLAWMLGLVLLPYLTVPVFLMLGFRKAGKSLAPVAFDADPSAPPTRLARTLTRLGAAPARPGNALTLLRTGEMAFAALTAIVAGARDDLDVMFYLIADDPVGLSFVETLTARVRAGVRVRLVIDRLGGFRRPRGALADFVAAGGQLRYFSPFLHRPERGHVNLRDHRKIVVADGEAAFAGGMNVGADYMGPSPDPGRFVDLSFVLRGPAVRDYAAIFLSDWIATGKRPGDAPARPVAPAGAAEVQVVPSGPDVKLDALHDGLVNAIHRADRRVWVTTPYFVPTDAMMRALMLAARRGVDVRCLIPRRSNHAFTDFARGACLRDLEAADCRLLFHETRMIHAKAGVVDDVAWVGSANLDVRSMLLNFESALFLHDGDSVGAVAEWFEALASHCATGMPVAGPVRRAVEGAFRLWTPLL